MQSHDKTDVPQYYRFLEPLNTLQFVVVSRIQQPRGLHPDDAADVSKTGSAALIRWQQKLLAPVEAWSLAKEACLVDGRDAVGASSSLTKHAHRKDLRSFPELTRRHYLREFRARYLNHLSGGTREHALPLQLGVVPPELPHRAALQDVEEAAADSLQSQQMSASSASGSTEIIAAASISEAAGQVFSALADRTLHISTFTSADGAIRPIAPALIAGEATGVADTAAGGGSAVTADDYNNGTTGWDRVERGSGMVQHAVDRRIRMGAARATDTSGYGGQQPSMVVSVSCLSDAEAVRGGGDDVPAAVVAVPVCQVVGRAGDSIVEVMPGFADRRIDVDAEEDRRAAAARRRRARKRVEKARQRGRGGDDGDDDGDNDEEEEDSKTTGGLGGEGELVLHWTDIFKRFSSRIVQLPRHTTGATARLPGGGAEQPESNSGDAVSRLSADHDGSTQARGRSLEVAVIIASELTEAEAIALSPVMGKDDFISLVELVKGSSGARVALKALGIGSDAIDKAHKTIREEMHNRVSQAPIPTPPLGTSKVVACCELTELSGVDSAGEYAVQYSIALRRTPAPPATTESLYRLVASGITQTSSAEWCTPTRSRTRSDLCCCDVLSAKASTGSASLNFPFDMLIETTPSDISRSIVIAVSVMIRNTQTSLMEQHSYGRAQIGLEPGTQSIPVQLWRLSPTANHEEGSFFLNEGVSIREAPESLLPSAGNLFGLHTQNAGILNTTVEIAVIYEEKRPSNTKISNTKKSIRQGDNGIKALIKEADELSLKSTALGID